MNELLDGVAKVQEIGHEALKTTLSDSLTAAERVIAMHGRSYNINSPTLNLSPTTSPSSNLPDEVAGPGPSRSTKTDSALGKVAKASILAAAVASGAALPVVLPAVMNMFSPAPTKPVEAMQREGSLLQFLEDKGFNRP